MLRKKRYRIVIEDESRLIELWSLKFTTLKAIIMSFLILIASICLSIFLIAFTPISYLLPGYMKKNQRIDSIETLLKLDSLQNQYESNQLYLNNIATIFDTERTPSDSSSLTKQNPQVIEDTIMPTSQEELEFIKMMQEREKYNTSILAPLAAEGMIFTTPSAGSIIEEKSIEKNSAKIIIPRGNVIRSITEGTIVDLHYDIITSSYTIIIQHEKGFLSKYIGTGQPLVSIGKNVITGENIALSSLSNSKYADCIILEIWRNGLPLIASQYITPKEETSTPSDSSETIGGDENN